MLRKASHHDSVRRRQILRVFHAPPSSSVLDHICSHKSIQYTPPKNPCIDGAIFQERSPGVSRGGPSRLKCPPNSLSGKKVSPSSARSFFVFSGLVTWLLQKACVWGSQAPSNGLALNLVDSLINPSLLIWGCPFLVLAGISHFWRGTSPELIHRGLSLRGTSPNSYTGVYESSVNKMFT